VLLVESGGPDGGSSPVWYGIFVYCTVECFPTARCIVRVRPDLSRYATVETSVTINDTFVTYDLNGHIIWPGEDRQGFPMLFASCVSNSVYSSGRWTMAVTTTVLWYIRGWRSGEVRSILLGMEECWGLGLGLGLG
jgi:hypothetical protein